MIEYENIQIRMRENDLSMSDVLLLDEIIERAMPTKQKYNICNVCGEAIETDSNYCSHCGQKLDWSE